VKEGVLPHLKKEYKIEVCGYSLGSIVAIWLALTLQEDYGYYIETIVTFGQPNVITPKDFRACLSLGVIRILTSKDPTRFFFEQCGHAGLQIILSSSGVVELDYLDDFGRQMSEDSGITKFLKRKVNNLQGYLSAHSLEEYTKKLKSRK